MMEGRGEVNCILKPSKHRLRDMNSLNSPIQDFLEIPALVAGIEVRVWGFESLNPVPCYHRHIGIAHDGLSDHFNAMI
jgi:hypothetical protein